MSREAMKNTNARGGRSPALIHDPALGPLSVGLSVAAIEFVLCGAILLALASFDLVPIEAAVKWAAVILVPLAATIGYLGIRVWVLSRRMAPGSHRIVPTNVPQAV